MAHISTGTQNIDRRALEQRVSRLAKCAHMQCAGELWTTSSIASNVAQKYVHNGAALWTTWHEKNWASTGNV